MSDLDTARPMFIADARMTRLLRALTRPRRLPSWLRHTLQSTGTRQLAALILDGILAIETSDGWTSGGFAAPFLFGNCDGWPRPANLHALTRAALRYGTDLDPDLGATELGVRMYRYHTVPASDDWLTRFPDISSVAGHLGLNHPRFAGGAWTSADAGKRSPWATWSGTASGPGRYKLYVSPHHEALHEALRVCLDQLARFRPVALKVGRTPHGILRPDRLVVYFERRADLVRAAEQLTVSLVDLPAHGVPFTAPLFATTLLSWGADLNPNGGPGLAADSWRGWVTRTLGMALDTVRRGLPAGLTPEGFALLRLSVDGVNPRTFAPSNTFFALHAPTA